MGIQLSFSACDRYLTSAFSYYLHYMLRIRPEENSSALFFGSAIDTGLNELLRPPLDRSPEALVRAKAAFAAAWGAAEINGEQVILSNPGVIKFSKADYDESVFPDFAGPGTFLNPSWQSMRYKGLMILEAYAAQVVPKIREVLAVQREISLTNDLGDVFIGVVDLIVVWEDGRRLLLDNKTAARKYDKNAVEISEQLATYFEAVKDEYQLDGIGFVVIPKKFRRKVEPLVPIDIMIGQVNEGIVAQTFEKYENVLDGIKNARFPCEQAKCCSKPWPCSYKRFCDSGGIDMTGLRYEKKRT
jgi:PD-(D/E)XK nuclease superfamily